MPGPRMYSQPTMCVMNGQQYCVVPHSAPPPQQSDGAAQPMAQTMPSVVPPPPPPPSFPGIQLPIGQPGEQGLVADLCKIIERQSQEIAHLVHTRTDPSRDDTVPAAWGMMPEPVPKPGIPLQLSAQHEAKMSKEDVAGEHEVCLVLCLVFAVPAARRLPDSHVSQRPAKPANPSSPVSPGAQMEPPEVAAVSDATSDPAQTPHYAKHTYACGLEVRELKSFPCGIPASSVHPRAYGSPRRVFLPLGADRGC